MDTIDFKQIFTILKGKLQNYAKNYRVLHDTETEYDLWSPKGLAAGKKAKLYEKFCAGITIRKHYVALYLMAFYKTDLDNTLKPELTRIYSGKYDFHVTQLDSTLEQQLADAIKANMDYFQEKKLI